MVQQLQQRGERRLLHGRARAVAPRFVPVLGLEVGLEPAALGDVAAWGDGGVLAGRKYYFDRNPPLAIACAFIANLVMLVAGTAVAVPSALARTRDP